MIKPKNSISVIISLVLTYIFLVCTVVLCFLMPKIAPGIFPDGHTAVCIAYYICVPAALIAVYAMVKLLDSIRKRSVFTMTNVLRIRALSWCCAYVALVTSVCGFFCYAMFVITFAALFMCIVLRVIKNVMAYAVEIRQENDLTI